jgi:hypothetical protein
MMKGSNRDHHIETCITFVEPVSPSDTFQRMAVPSQSLKLDPGKCQVSTMNPIELNSKATDA